MHTVGSRLSEAVAVGLWSSEAGVVRTVAVLEGDGDINGLFHLCGHGSEYIVNQRSKPSAQLLGSLLQSSVCRLFNTEGNKLAFHRHWAWADEDVNVSLTYHKWYNQYPTKEIWWDDTTHTIKDTEWVENCLQIDRSPNFIKQYEVTAVVYKLVFILFHTQVLENSSYIKLHLE